MMTSGVAWVLHIAGSLTLQRLAVVAVQLCEALQVADLIRNACDDDVRCSMGATYSGFLLTLEIPASFTVQLGEALKISDLTG